MLENKILEDREKKYLLIREYAENFDCVSLKANIPGENKRLKIAYCLINYFKHTVELLGSKSTIALDGFDGPMYLFLFDKDSIDKETLVGIEELTLGRYVDIDLYTTFESKKRSEPRRCVICGDIAFKCIRMMKHSNQEIISKIESDYLRVMSLTIKHLARLAMEEELRLSPKFGLVSEDSSGSHKDMDFDMMMRSRDVIAPYFSDMFNVSIKSDVDDVFEKIREIGKRAEEAMLESSGGINCYKGLIFILGLLVSALGIEYSRLNPTFDDLFDLISMISMPIMKDYLGKADTFGKRAFNSLGIKGARGEAASGLKTVRMLIDEFELDDRKSLMEALARSISQLDDTVLLKRCGSYEKYSKTKKKFESFKYDEDVINAMTRECICENLSFGGSADILVTAIFLKNFKKPLNYFKRLYY